MTAHHPLEQLQRLGTQVLRALVDAPVQALLGRHRHPERQLGAPPGSLFISADASPTEIRLWIIDGAEVRVIDEPDEAAIRAARGGAGRLWLDVAGLADDRRLRALGELFELHPLTLADLVNVERQSKLERLEAHDLIVMQGLQVADGGDQAVIQQLGLVLLDDILLSFRERPGPLFDPVLARLERPGSRLRTQGLDYLACALLDVTVDAGFPVVETLTDQIDRIEEQVMAGRGALAMAEIHRQRRALITLGRLLWRQRDLLSRLSRDESVFGRGTQIYLRDVQDRTVQLLDMVETSRELAASLVEIHLSMSANRSNQIMQTLTIMASIFIPLTFVAGVYGMNFVVMPELEHPWGYPAVLGLMLAIALGLLWWFRRRGWLGQGADDPPD